MSIKSVNQYPVSQRFGLKRILRTAAKIAAVAVCVISVLLIALTAYHHISLNAESGKITPNGQLVDVSGSKLHVYTEGNNMNAPTLVFLSGAGTAAPVYDFKPLYSQLSDKFRIAVVEKLGYGYADIADYSRDIDTILDQSRKALRLAGVEAPYVLIPHSMSGLEALYWATKYPDEIAGIVGLDMAVPEDYLSGAVQTPALLPLQFGAFVGVQRLPFVYPISEVGLSALEFKQTQYLTYRNAANRVVAEEAKNLLTNADTVSKAGIPKVPMLLFCGDGEGLGDWWVPRQEAFASEMNAKLVKLNCSHYIHQFEPKKIASEINAFLLPQIEKTRAVD